MINKCAYILFMLFVLSLNKVYAHFTPDCVKDSTVEYKIEGGVLIPYSKTFFSYDTLGNKLFEEVHVFSSADQKWIKTTQTNRIYNSYSMLISEELLLWNSSNNIWEISAKTQNSYFSDTLLEITTKYSASNSTWIPVSKKNYVNPASTTFLQTIDYDWSGSVWVEKFKVEISQNSDLDITSYQTYFYDTTNDVWVGNSRQDNSYLFPHVLSQSVSYEWALSSWNQSQKTEYNYSVDTLLLSSINYTWNASAWDNFSKTENNYVGKNLTQTITFSWNGSIWVYSQKNLYQYDPSGNTLNYELYSYDNLNTKWKGISKGINTYNSKNQKIKFVSQVWNSTTETWEDGTLMFDFEYDIFDNLIFKRKTLFNSVTKLWVYNSQEIYSFNDQNVLISFIYQTWDKNLNIWVNVSKDSSFYDSYLNEIGEQSFAWDNVLNDWQTTYLLNKYIKTFNISPENYSECSIEKSVEINIQKLYNANYEWFLNDVNFTSQWNGFSYTANELGIFRAVIHSEFCTYNTESASLNLFPTTDKPILNSDRYSVYVDSTSLFESIDWFFENELILADSLKINFPEKGNYKVRIIDENGCTAESDELNFNVSEHYYLFPHISNSTITLFSSEEIEKIMVFDAKGSFILEKYYDSQICELDVSNLKNGLYILKSQRLNGENLGTSKFVKF